MNRIKVLMVGPSLDSKGGISAVANQYMNANMLDDIEIRYVATACDGNKVRKLLTWIVGIIQFILKVWHFDIVHVHMASNNSFERKQFIIRIATFAKKNIIIHLHGGGFEDFYNNCTNKKKKHIRYIFSLANTIIVLSNQWYDFINSITIKKEIVILRNSVSCGKDKNDYSDNNIVFLGKLCKYKGIDDLIEVASLLKRDDIDYKLYLAGNGQVEYYKRMTLQNGLENNIEFLGWIDEDKKSALLEKCSIFVLPSYNEGLPISMLEAMSFGLAVVVTDVGGIPMVINNEDNGLTYHAGNITELTNILKKLLSDISLKEMIGQNARNTVEREYSLSQHTTNLRKIYKNIVQR